MGRKVTPRANFLVVCCGPHPRQQGWYKQRPGFLWYYQNATFVTFASVEVEDGLLRSHLLHQSGARSFALKLCKFKRANPLIYVTKRNSGLAKKLCMFVIEHLVVLW